MLERIDQILASRAMTFITGTLFLLILLHTSFDMTKWMNTPWMTILAFQCGL